ncbi:MAG TPA: fumarylacetoacetate hydrolase family protein [Vicinamibacterales bacterium]|nr:fumarylacetoacetate hydrolase family protein [Vicinamibacterales bacterium]
MRGTREIAAEIAAAYRDKQVIPTPASRESGFDLTAAYAVERDLVRMRAAEGRITTGVKVGFANKAMWRVLKLDTLVWAHMYDDTVRHAAHFDADVSVKKYVSPKIEPEIVFKLWKPLPEGHAEPTAVLDAVESIALGFEIIDCVYPDWKFTPIDFVAAYGLHAGLIVGAPLPITAHDIPALVDQLAAFTVTLKKNGDTVAQGSGKNSLKSPALCLGELGLSMAKQAAEPLAPGEFVSSGTLTEAQLIAPGETYTATVDGIDLPSLTVRIVP